MHPRLFRRRGVHTRIDSDEREVLELETCFFVDLANECIFWMLAPFDTPSGERPLALSVVAGGDPGQDDLVGIGSHDVGGESGACDHERNVVIV